MTKYADLFKLSEDERIKVIGSIVMSLPVGKVVGFVTEDEGDKAERYATKLIAAYPLIEVIDSSPGPIPNTKLVRVRRTQQCSK